jgi:hypothetical protein
MLYELRMYRTAPGRVHDVANRMRDLVPPLFRKHGFPVPHAEWIVSAGAHMPMYVWLLSWPDSTQRAQAFSSLYADQEWAELRRQTNGPREMVLKYDIYLMHGAPAWDAAKTLHADRSGPAAGLHELRIYELYPGRGSQANRTLTEVDLPALKKAGGTTLGVFDIQSGPALPAFAHFLQWENYEARRTGITAYEHDPSVVSARKAEVEELKTHVLGQHSTWLLEPTDFRTASFGFS